MPRPKTPLSFLPLRRVTVRFTLKSTMANQLKYGDVLVPPNEVFQKIKGSIVRVSGYSYLTFVPEDHRISEELQGLVSFRFRFLLSFSIFRWDFLTAPPPPAHPKSSSLRICPIIWQM
jgi:hypothetical protein